MAFLRAPGSSRRHGRLWLASVTCADARAREIAMGFRSSEAQEPAALQALVSHIALGFSVGAVLIAILAVVTAALARVGGLRRRDFDEHLE